MCQGTVLAGRTVTMTLKMNFWCAVDVHVLCWQIQCIIYLQFFSGLPCRELCAAMRKEGRRENQEPSRLSTWIIWDVNNFGRSEYFVHGPNTGLWFLQVLWHVICVASVCM